MPGRPRLAGGIALAAADPGLRLAAGRFCGDARRRTGVDLRLDPAAERPAVQVEVAQPAVFDAVPREPIGLSPAAETVPDER